MREAGGEKEGREREGAGEEEGGGVKKRDKSINVEMMNVQVTMNSSHC